MNPKKLTPLLYLAAAGAIAVSAVALLERSEFLGQASASSYTMTLDKSSLNYFPSVSLGDLTASCTFPTALGNPIGFNFSTSGYASSRGFFAGIGGGKNPTYMKNTTPIHGITSVYLEIIKYDYSDDDTLPPTITFSDYADFRAAARIPERSSPKTRPPLPPLARPLVTITFGPKSVGATTRTPPMGITPMSIRPRSPSVIPRFLISASITSIPPIGGSF